MFPLLQFFWSLLCFILSNLFRNEKGVYHSVSMSLFFCTLMLGTSFQFQLERNLKVLLFPHFLSRVYNQETPKEAPDCYLIWNQIQNHVVTFKMLDLVLDKFIVKYKYMKKYSRMCNNCSLIFLHL